jgi:glutathione S-transferase
MPKPDVIALTGGYRKTPLLQIGNHVYCDTALIVRVLEARQPTPPLLAGPVADIVAQWADSFVFDNAVSLAFRPSRIDALMKLMRPEELTTFAPDRKEMTLGARRLPPPYGTARAQLPLIATRLEQMLQGQPYLLGQTLTLADLSAYHCCWFVDMTSPEVLEPFTTLRQWMERVAAIGHGHAESISSADAIDICRRAQVELSLPEHSSSELTQGQRVRVRATDLGREESVGDVVCATADEVVIARDDERAGRVLVHFPRLGYDVIPA